MKPPGATGQGLGHASSPANSTSTGGRNATPTSNSVLVTFTQPHMLSFFVIISTLLRLNVFKLDQHHPQSNAAHLPQSNAASRPSQSNSRMDQSNAVTSNNTANNTTNDSTSSSGHSSTTTTTGTTTTSGSGTCSGIDLACIYVIRGLKRILSSLDPEALPLRHIIRFKVITYIQSSSTTY